jgi:hypothetical protein
VVDSAGSNPAAGTTACAPSRDGLTAPSRGRRVAAGHHLQFGVTVAVLVVPGDRHVPRHVGAAHGGARPLQAREKRDVRLSVGVARTHADQHGARRHRGKERGRAVAAPVVRRLLSSCTGGYALAA